MSNHSTSTEEVESETQINQLRELILGKDSHLVTDCVKKEARNLVGNVLTEAVNDRQKKDGSVNKVLLPLVESAVETSVTHHSDKLISSLYPLMGRLVRKSVTAFLTDFMEKTNQLIENSFTIKGLKWRFIAWQSGVSFSQYVASQIFLYRVEHVFLIHRETGLLLKSVNSVSQNDQDADLISSMLTAINDFVGDSFSISEDGLKEQLQTVSTDTFNLLIKPGPNALVVAAVIGNPPQKVNDQLQITLEDVHSLYEDELTEFSGDNEIFENSENLLQECLLSEQKNDEEDNRKTPWFAWIIILVIIVFTGFKAANRWNEHQLAGKLTQLDNQPGIVLKQLNVIDVNTIELNILRDPEAITVTEWLLSHHYNIDNIKLTEHPYYSLAPQILYARAQKSLANFPNVTGTIKNDILVLVGSVDTLEMQTLLNSLTQNGYVNGSNLNIELLHTKTTSNLLLDREIKNGLFNKLVKKISTVQLDFASKSDELTTPMKNKLQRLYFNISQLNKLANELEIDFGLIIMGCSDNTGNKSQNDLLSLNRAKNTLDYLSDLGLDENAIYATGIGQINIESIHAEARKVIFNIIHVNRQTQHQNKD